jgi:hypothetical protein
MGKFFVLNSIILLALNLSSQNNKSTASQNLFFDEKAAIQQAIAKGIKSSEINGYVQFLKNDYSSKNVFAKQSHVHSPYENNQIKGNTIYLAPSKIVSADCNNMGFEYNNFIGWIGSIGNVTTGTTMPNYNSTASTINTSAGNNVSLMNTINYHTIMTIPATNAIYPNFIGYDSIACKIVGANTVSQIPVVSPFSTDGASVRMNGALANNRGCQLKYITTTSTTNKKLSYSFALILNDGGHIQQESPYFKVEIINESTGTILPGCNKYITFQTPSQPSDSMFTSVLGSNDISCRKWKLYTVDLSSLPLGTNVSVNFEVGGCAQGGHFGYAYVDAECGATSSGGVIDYMKCDMCPGATNALLVAPLGYTAYQWLDPTNNAILGATTNTLSVLNPTVGYIYSVQLTAAAGCLETKTVAISTSSISINNISTIGTCSNGNSGSATINMNGSNGIYSYTWTSIGSGNVVGNSQTVSNLSPGNYSVVVNSGTCGQASGTLTIPTTAPSFLQQSKSFCGNNTYITTNSGTNHQWYIGNTIVAPPNGINDTLFINNVTNGNAYTVVYTNTGNCKDSIRYTLNQLLGGSVSMSNINNVCLGNANGSGVVTLNPVNPAPYTFNISNASGLISNGSISSTTYSVNNLTAGTYTSTVSDGNCSYTNTFTINTIQTNFTMTPGSSSVCSSADTARINFTFGNSTPANCTLSSSGNCSSPNSVQIGFGTSLNTSTTYPSIYSNWYRNARHQLLYKASELLAAGVQPGKISSVSFNINTIAGTTTYHDFTIKMKCTNTSNLTAAFDSIGLSQVFYSSLINITTGWNTYQFPTPYEWDGVSNIIVDVCSGFEPTYTNNSISPYTTTPFVSVNYFNSDATLACSQNMSNLTSSNRPNIQFENYGISSPATYSISVSSNGTIVQNYNNDSIKVVPVTTPTADIVYTITVTNPDGGCTASQTFTMSNNLAATTTVTNASCGSCPNGTVQAIVSCGAAPFNYLWSPGGQTTQSVSGLLPGCYTVTVTDATLENVSSEACVTFSTKLNEKTLTSGLSIYPNPSNGIFNLLSETILNKLDIVVVNLLGQTVISETANHTNQIIIDLGKASKGIYYAKVTSNEGTKLFKLILE